MSVVAPVMDALDRRIINALQGGYEPRVTAADGRAAIEMTEAASRSAATGRAINLPLAD